MPVKLEYGVGRKFYSADQSKSFARYDLTGHQQKAQQLHQTLSDCTSEFAILLTRQARRVFSDDSLTVSCDEWTSEAPESFEAQLRAFPDDHRNQNVVLGADRIALFRLSELFFGGEPEKLVDKQLAMRKLVETERRLMNRVLEMILDTLGSLQGYGVDTWQSYWPESASDISETCFWTRLRFSGAGWESTLYLGWPVYLATSDDCRPTTDATLVRSGLGKALRNVRTALTVEIAAIEIQVGQIEQLRPGDILPLSLNDNAIARVHNSELLEGTVCENGEHLAFRVTRYLGAEND